ncbi:MAG: hypothetical protein QGH33_02300 [Pirellulaceae bacterium]|nr:hypothetical protein [Pirellulaceae bacterium]
MNTRVRLGPVVALLTLATCAWFAVSVAQPFGEERLVFGLWRTWSFAIGVLLCWLTACAASVLISRRALFRAIFASVLLAITWTLAEAIGLLGWVPYKDLIQAPWRPLLAVDLTPMLDIRGQTYQDMTIRWGVPSEAITFHFKTDRYGFRNHVDRENADVYVVGDSIVVAGKLPFEQTVTSRLEQILGRPVMNLAKSASGPQEQREMFHSAGVPVRNRIVLHVLFEGNDLQDSAEYRYRIMGIPPARTLADRSFTRNVFWLLARITHARFSRAHEYRGRVGDEDYFFFYCRERFIDTAPEFEHLRRTLEQFRTEIVAGGGTYAVVIIPTKLRTLGPICDWPQDSILSDDDEHLSPLRDLLHQWADETGVPICDVTDDLERSATQGDIPWFPIDSHLNATGHQVIADSVASSTPIREFLSRHLTAQ